MDDLAATPTPTDLDLALGTQEIPEAAAFSAFQSLQSNEPALDQPLDLDGNTGRQEARKTLKAYVDRSRAFNRPLFPEATARANKKRNEYTRRLFTEDLADVLDPEQHAALEQRAKHATNPEAYRSRQILKTYLNSAAGQTIPAGKFDFARDQFAAQLGLKDDTSDSAVFQEIRRRYQEHADTTAKLETVAGFIDDNVFSTNPAHNGGDFITRRINELVGDFPERLQNDARSELLNHYRKTRDLKRTTKPVADRIVRYIGQAMILRGDEAAAATDTDGVDLSQDPEILEDAVDQLLKLSPQEQQAAAMHIRATLENLPDQDGILKRSGEAIWRTTAGLSRDSIQFLRQLLFTGTAQAAGIQPEESGNFAEFDARFQARAQVLQSGGIAPLFQPSDGWGAKAVVGGSSQLPTFAAFFGGPAGIAALGTSMAGSSLQGQRLETPDAPVASQLASATVSGTAQAGLEFAMTKTGLRLLKGRAPTLSKLLSKNGIRNAYARSAIAFPALAAGAAATEYTEEIAQAATDRILADVTRELAGFDANTDWKGFFADWMPNSGTRQSEEVLAAVVPFALLGSGAVGSYSHFRQGQWLQQSKTALKAVGIPEARIEAIQSAEPAEAAKLTQEAFQEGLEEVQAEQRTKALEVLKEAATLYEEAGYPIVFPETNDFTEETSFIFQADPFDPSTRQAFATEEEALTAFQQAALDMESDALDAITDAARETILDTIAGEGTAAENSVDFIPLETAAPSITKAADVTDAFGNPVATPEQIRARVQEFLVQGGQRKDIPNLIIKAKRIARTLRNGTTRQIVQYFKDSDPIALMEDTAESLLDQGLTEGFLEAADIVQQLRQVEAATGNRYLAENYDPATGNRLPLLEGFSAFARDYVFTSLRSQQLPDELRAWVSASAVFTGQGFSYAKELARVPNVRKALDEGRIDAGFEAMVGDMLGMNPAEIDARLQTKYEAELAAEALEGFPEIGDAAKGKLPHPQTLRDAQHPLTGEVQRLYDGLKRPTRRKKKNGDPVENTRAANAYFLPYGEMIDLDTVRGSLNEDGFAFDSIQDMLDALDGSLNYQIPTHATATLEEDTAPSFALGTKGMREIFPSTNHDANIIPANELPARIQEIAEARKLAIVGSADLARIAQSIEEAFGLRPIFYTSEADTQTLGFSPEGNRELIFINAAPSDGRPLSWTAAHEILHAAQQDPSVDTDALWEDLKGLLSSEELADAEATLTGAGYTGDTWSRELPAYLMGDAISGSNAYGLDLFENAQAIEETLTGFFDSIPKLDPQSLEQTSDDDLARGTFALSPANLNRLEAAIAQKLTEGPAERADYYERVRNRLAGVLLRFNETAPPLNQTETERETQRIREALAEAKAIIQALPADARGRIALPTEQLIAAKTERGKVTILKQLIADADAALEAIVSKDYLEAIAKLIDLAKPDVNPHSKQARGRLTPKTQRAVAQILQVIDLDPATIEAELFGIDLKIEEIDTKLADPSTTQDDTKKLIAERIELELQRVRVDTFGALSKQSAAEIAHAFDSLQSLYRTGRLERNIIDDAQRQEREAMRREVVDALPPVDQTKWATTTGKEGLGELVNAWKLGHYSFHQFMESIFPKSTTARHFQSQARKAETGFRRAMIDSRQRWEDWARETFQLPRRGWHRKLNRILADLSVRKDTGIQIAEGVRFQSEKLTPEQAEAIIRGDMKVGWQDDLIAIASLRQALADFKIARAKDQSRAEFVRFQRLQSRGKETPFLASDLEILYLLQLAAQPQYLPALDRYGFTREVLDKLIHKIDPHALAIGDHLAAEYAAEYDRLNPVFQRLYGFDMPQIRNYAPGMFENMKAGNTRLDPDSGVDLAANAMAAGFTKNRTHHTARPRQENALSVYWSHIHATEYFIHWAELVRDMRAVFNHPTVRRAIQGNYGKDVAIDFSRWLEALELDGNFPEVMNRASAKLAANIALTTSAVGLAFNVGSVLKQSQAALNGLLQMSVTDSIKGIMAVARDPSAIRKAWNSEPIQQRILEGMNPEDRKLLQAAQAKPSNILDAYRIGRAPLAWGDAAATTLYSAVAYSYHYEQAKKQKLSDAQAEEHALRIMDEVIKRTAQPATTQDKSLAELTATRWGHFIGYIFRSDPRQKLAISMKAWEDLAKGRIGKPEAIRKTLVGWMIYGMMNELMGDVWQAISRDEDDEDRWAPRDYLAAAIAGPLSGGGILGALAESAIRGAIGTDWYGGSTLAADVVRLTNNQGSKTLKTILDDTDNTMSEVLKAALSDARAYASALGAIEPRIGILAVSARTLRDASGIITNLTPTEADRQDAILRKYKQEQKDARAIRAEERAAEKGPAPRLTPQERQLKGLSSEHRANAIKEIVAPMTPTERTDYLARLQDVGLLTPTVQAFLSSEN